MNYRNVKPDRYISALKCNFNDLGVPLSKEKTLGPCKAISFLGITLDSDLMQASLPSDKLNHIREVKRNAKKLVSFSKRDLLSLLGHLNFAMQIIPQGSFFIARLLDFSKSVKDLNDIVTLDQRFSIPVLNSRYWGVGTHTDHRVSTPCWSH